MNTRLWVSAPILAGLALGLFPSFTRAEPRLAVENLTKMPGTDRGFPAEDSFVFNLIRHPALGTSYGTLLYGYANTQRMRIHNRGTSVLTLEDLVIADRQRFKIDWLSDGEFPLRILPGSFREVRIKFIEKDWRKEAKGIHVSSLTLRSDGGDQVVRLAGGYALLPEGGNELTLKQIFELFGITTDVPERGLPSDYPVAGSATPEAFGELVVSEYWEQADPREPVRAIQLIAQKSKGGSPVALVDADGNVVAGFSFTAGNTVSREGTDVLQCQSLFPRLEENPDVVAGDWADFVEEPFRISIHHSTTSGSGDLNPETGKPYFLSPKLYPVRDTEGRILPHHYVAAMDFTPLTGSEPSNSDFNDNVIYFTNIRPKDGTPALSLVRD